MLPFIQFDPASFCLWIDLRIPSDIDETIYSDLTNSILLNQDLNEKEFIKKLTKSEEIERSLALSIYSALIHEKRHFLDLTLSNYGQFKHRLFSEFYFNLSAIIKYFQDKKYKLVTPMHLHLDKNYCIANNIPPIEDEIQSALLNYKERLNMLQTDSSRLDFHGKTIQIGGDAQLEALAFLSQTIACQHLFGFHGMSDNWLNWPAIIKNPRYTWILDLGQATGLINVTNIGDKGVFLDITRVFPLIFASLQSRHWGQLKKTKTKDFKYAGLPSTRLAVFTEELRDLRLKPKTTSEVWEAISKISTKRFGRTLIEEMEDDIYSSERFIEGAKQNQDMNPTILEWSYLIHTRRKETFNIFQLYPDIIIDPDLSFDSLTPRLKPYPLLCSKEGSFEEPPNEFFKIMSYEDNFGQQQKKIKWWWVSGPKDNMKDDCFTYGDAKLHAHIASEYAPISKFLMHAHRQRVMLGAELELAQSTLVHKFGIDVFVDPVIGSHREKSEVESYFFLFGGQKKSCDLCSSRVGVNESELLSKWIFKSRQVNAEFLLEHFKDHPLGMIFVLKDWTEWLICHGCCKKLNISTQGIRTKEHSSNFQFEGDNNYYKDSKIVNYISKSMHAIANRKKFNLKRLNKREQQNYIKKLEEVKNMLSK